MRTVTLQATAKHPDRKAGELYESAGGEALLDLSLRRAIAYRAPSRPILHLPSEYQTKDEKADGEIPVKQKRRYKRRDMRAAE